MTRGETIPGAVAASIAARPDAEAVVEPAGRVSYAELGERVDSATRAMLAAGVEPGERVAIWAPNGLGWIVAALAAQSAGAALVPINTRFKGHEAAHVLSASQATLLGPTSTRLSWVPSGSSAHGPSQGAGSPAAIARGRRGHGPLRGRGPVAH